MSAQSTSDSNDREFCPAVSADGTRCDFAVHPGAVHWTWRNGYPHPWQALPARDEVWRNQAATDAPQLLIDAALQVRPDVPEDFNPLANLYRDPALPKLAQQNPRGHEMTQRLHDLLRQGRAPEVYNRPLVEATSLDGRFAYGLLDVSSSSVDAPVVHETMPGSGGVPTRVVILPDSIREVFVPGHRGDCHGDCTREGMDNDNFYPECWDWRQVKAGVAERYRAWKDWVL